MKAQNFPDQLKKQLKNTFLQMKYFHAEESELRRTVPENRFRTASSFQKEPDPTAKPSNKRNQNCIKTSCRTQ